MSKLTGDEGFFDPEYIRKETEWRRDSLPLLRLLVGAMADNKFPEGMIDAALVEKLAHALHLACISIEKKFDECDALRSYIKAMEMVRH